MIDVWSCVECTAEYTSPLAAAVCAEEDVARDRGYNV